MIISWFWQVLRAPQARIGVAAFGLRRGAFVDFKGAGGGWPFKRGTGQRVH